MSKTIKEKFETFLHTIDWSSPKLSRQKEYLLYKIKNAQNDEELLDIMCGVFYHGHQASIVNCWWYIDND
jgi:hypothetical protein